VKTKIVNYFLNTVRQLQSPELTGGD